MLDDGKPFDQAAEHNLGFHTRQRGAQAVVDAATEGNVTIGVWPVKTQCIRTIENGVVVVGRGKKTDDLVANRNCMLTYGHRLGRYALHHLHW